MHTITVTVGGKTVVLGAGYKQSRFDSKAPEKREARDEADKWPSQSRAAAGMLQNRNSAVPRKADSKGRGGHRGKASAATASKNLATTARQGVGTGSNSTKGVRAYAGMLRAIAAEVTDCRLATKAEEQRIRAVPRATTKRTESGMQFVHRQPR